MLLGVIGHRSRVMRTAMAFQVGWLLAGCSTIAWTDRVPTIGSADWSHVEASVPTEVHGQVPGVSNEALAAVYPNGRSRQIASLSNSGLIGSDIRVELYLNPSHVSAVTDLCDQQVPITDGVQDGSRTNVIAVLCNGDRVVSRAEGSAMLVGLPPEDLKLRLDRFRLGLFTVHDDAGNEGHG